jgi:superfamily II DNA or RNA helicase
VGIELYPHNQKAYESAVAALALKGETAIIHPTGTGKSFIGFKLAETFPEARVCWLSPSEYIVKTQLENLKSRSECSLENITFITYAKLMLTRDEEIKTLSPDYIILDEFHRCGALEWGGGVARLRKFFPGAKTLGLSATSIRYLDNQRDMAEELFGGNIASEITLGEAIAHKILPAPTYVISIYSYKSLFSISSTARK